MNVQFIAGIAVIAADPAESRKLYVGSLGSPLEAIEGSDYFDSEHIGGSKHSAVWPLSQAAQACFGSEEWPSDRPVAQASIEFEVEDADAVQGHGGGAAPRRLRAAARRAYRAVGTDSRPAAVGRGRDSGDLTRARVARVT
jgi:hypothetical protein